MIPQIKTMNVSVNTSPTSMPIKPTMRETKPLKSVGAAAPNTTVGTSAEMVTKKTDNRDFIISK